MSRGSKMMVISDPQVTYVRSILSGWVQDTVNRINGLSDDFFQFLDWVLKDSTPLLESILARGKKMRNRDIAQGLERLRENMDEGEDFSTRHTLEHLCAHHPAFDRMVREEVTTALQDIRKDVVTDKTFTEARRRMTDFFGLDANCQTLCEALYIFECFRDVDHFYNDAREYRNLRFLGYLLNMPVADIRQAVDRLEQCGLVEVPRHHGDITLPACSMQLWDSETFDSSRLFGQPMEGDCLALKEFHIKPRLVSHAKKLMSQKDDAPVHILLYGAPGTGKTTFARSLAKACGVRAWSVNSRDRGEDSERARRAALMACLNMAGGLNGESGGDFVVVDEAERMLDTSGLFENTKDKAWLNALLERRNQRIVWITNEVGHIDPAVRRRFSLAVHFDKLGFKERCNVWQRVLEKQQATKLMDKEDISRLALRYPAEAAIISDSVAQARRLYPRKAAFTRAVELLLDSQERLQCNGRKKKGSRKAVSDFSVEGVCSKDSVHELLDRCRRIDKAMHENRDLRPGCGTMLFYGPPGTGKTALARHIAATLGRDCLVKRASDLMSKYVGESEQLIAGAFRDAERQGAVLVIDEADSFIYSRDIAQRSWESTMVNEFLTALEECRSFCVCTTNRRDQLDAAAIRRFAHKLEFTYAGEEQILALYKKLLEPLCPGEALSEAQKERLLKLDRLTPGDFHTVRSQFDPLYVDPACVNHDKLVSALAREQEQKLDVVDKGRVGF